MELAALRYKLCESTTHIEECVIEELKAAPNELNPKFLEQLTESIQIIHTNITGAYTTKWVHHLEGRTG